MKVNTDEKAKKKRRKVKKRRVSTRLDEEDVSVVNKLKDRHSRKKDEQGNTIAVLNTNDLTISHPTSYIRIMEKTTESQMNKNLQPELPGDLLSSQWRCALCHERSCKDNLGDLFGPYYVRIHPDNKWPSFLLKSTHKPSRHDWHSLDIWMHGYCALWTPDLHLVGGQFLDLETRVVKYWSQNCTECHRSGATIPISNSKFLHYPCAVKRGCRFDERTFTCHVPTSTI
uniref:PHD-type domain-containing protein n=2 Tax=Acrobeloides nanus TaxID=290746 RepID=A0A914CSN5_9BILA